MTPEQEQEVIELSAEEQALKEQIDRIASVLENGAPDERIAAVAQIVEAHNIKFYPVLRWAVMNDPDQTVRDTVRKATYVLEEEFGEDNCLAVQAENGGSFIESRCSAEDAAAVGNYLGASINDFR